jgi:mono/diheme cytochrome c family protein
LGAVAVASALLAGGCGGGGGPARTTSAGTTNSAAKLLFVRNCGACHKLSAAGTAGSVGADLDEVHPSRGAVLRAIVEGPGSMPPALVTGTDAQSVADYVARTAGR